MLLTILIAPLAGYTIYWLGRALKRTHRRAMQELSSIYETLAETLGGSPVRFEGPGHADPLLGQRR